MSVIATALKHMMAAGMDAAAILEAVAALEADLIATAANDRPPSKGAMRTRRYRERHKASQSVTSDDSDVQASQCDGKAAPPNEYISNPPEKPLSPKGDPSLSSQIGIVVSDWNEMAARTGIAAVRGALTGKRLASLKARLAEHGLDAAKQAIAAVARSPFCRGEVKDWRADFKFFVVPDNFAKLLEGGYDPPGKVTAITGKPLSDLDRQRIANFTRMESGEITDREYEQERHRLDRLEAHQRSERLVAQ